jgi:hypothetical protein
MFDSGLRIIKLNYKHKALSSNNLINVSLHYTDWSFKWKQTGLSEAQTEALFTT